jgi:hypothetical protein
MRWVAVLTAAIALAGCGGRVGGDAARSDPEPLHSYRFEFGTAATFDGADDGRTTGRGAYAADGTRWHVVEEFDGDQGSRYETVVVGGDLYTRLDDEETWDHLPGSGNTVGVPFEPFGDPDTIAQRVEDASTKLAHGGSRVIRGVETTYVNAVVDPDRLFGERPLPHEDGEPVAAIPVDLWIDADRRVRRAAWTMRSSADGKDSVHETWVEFFDFGAPVEIKAPPADEITRSPDGGEAECEAPAYEPLTPADVARVLVVHGFDVRIEEPVGSCRGATVSNMQRLRAGEGRPQPFVGCAFRGPNSSHSFMAFTSDGPPPREVEVEVANVACTLFVTNEQAAFEDAFRAALAALEPRGG